MISTPQKFRVKNAPTSH